MPGLQIRLNGEDREVDEDTTVEALLRSLGLARDGIAVAVDLVVVPRGQHAGRVLRPGESVEIIQAVGGG